MRPRRLLKISLTDEARLQTIGSVTLTPLKTVAILVCGLFAVILIGYFVVLITPLKTFIPGYFRESQRAETENALLRVDSLTAAFTRNEAYIANLNSIFDTDRPAISRDHSSTDVAPLTPDSLLPTSGQETSFVKMMQEREKFNISVIASMAAEGMLFYPATEEGIIAEDSRDSRQARIILPDGASVMAVADGVVIASYFEAADGGYSIILQHDNGFVSIYSSLGTPLVGESERVAGGQILALPPSPKKGRPSEIFVSLWHDSASLIPSEYITVPHSLTSFQQ